MFWWTQKRINELAKFKPGQKVRFSTRGPLELSGTIGSAFAREGFKDENDPLWYAVLVPCTIPGRPTFDEVFHVPERELRIEPARDPKRAG